MSIGNKNIYICQLCGETIVTIDSEEGCTPFMIDCKATEGCEGYMRSSFYAVDQSLVPEYEWYKPTSFEQYTEGIHREVMEKHVEDGGLEIRKL